MRGEFVLNRATHTVLWRTTLLLLGAELLCACCGAAALEAVVPRPAQATVVNSGVPGENSTELLARCESEVMAWTPRYVVVYTGMNDAVNEKKFTSIETFESNLRQIVRVSQAAGATTFLVTIQAVDEPRLMQRHAPDAYGARTPNARIADRNAVVRRVSRQTGALLVAFDLVLQAAGGPNTRLITDGVHLTTDGYGLLAHAVWNRMERQWRPGQRILCLGDSLTFGQGVRPPGATTITEDGTAYPTYPEQLRALAAAGHH